MPVQRTGDTIEIHGAASEMCATIGGGTGFARGLGGMSGKCGCINRKAISTCLMLS